MLEELHVHKVECMYHMYVLGITGDCDGHAVASEANWKWGGLDISENFQQGKKRGDGYGYVLLCKTNGGGGDSNAFDDSLFHWTFIKYTTTKFFSTRVCTGELVMIDWHTKYWFNFWHSWIKSWRWWGVPEILFAHCEPNKQ